MDVYSRTDMDVYLITKKKRINKNLRLIVDKPSLFLIKARNFKVMRIAKNLKQDYLNSIILKYKEKYIIKSLCLYSINN